MRKKKLLQLLPAPSFLFYNDCKEVQGGGHHPDVLLRQQVHAEVVLWMREGLRESDEEA